MHKRISFLKKFPKNLKRPSFPTLSLPLVFSVKMDTSREHEAQDSSTFSKEFPTSLTGRNELNVKRLQKDFQDIIVNGKDHGILVRLSRGDLLSWEAIITGPEDTPWEGGLFRLKLKFSDSYPLLPPEVRFLTPIFHPNVYVDGRVCLSILDSFWSPSLSVQSVLLSLQSLLSDPNPRSSANAEAGGLLVNNPNEYYRRVLDSVEASVLDDDNFLSDDEDDEE